MLLELADEISYTVVDLFNRSLVSGEYLQSGCWQMLHPYLKKESSAYGIAGNVLKNYSTRQPNLTTETFS